MKNGTIFSHDGTNKRRWEWNATSEIVCWIKMAFPQIPNRFIQSLRNHHTHPHRMYVVGFSTSKRKLIHKNVNSDIHGQSDIQINFWRPFGRFRQFPYCQIMSRRILFFSLSCHLLLMLDGNIVFRFFDNIRFFVRQFIQWYLSEHAICWLLVLLFRSTE